MFAKKPKTDWLRQDRKIYLPHNLQQCSTARKEFLPPHKHSWQIMLKIFSKRQNTKKKKSDENEAIRLKSASNQESRKGHNGGGHTIVLQAAPAQLAKQGVSPMQVPHCHPTSHHCCLCTITRNCTATDRTGLLIKSKFKFANQ